MTSRALVACLAALAIGTGCAAADGAGDPSSASDPVNGEAAPHASGSATSGEDDAPPPPDFDASFPDDPPPPSTPPADQCIDKDDEGSSESVAKSLPAIDDHDGSGGTVTGVVNGPVDVDFFKLEGTDTWTGVVNPTVTSGSTGAEVCMFVACMGGSIDFQGCSGGTKATSDIGNPGCCVAAPGSTTLDYNCVGTSSESANVFIRVRQTADKCLPYSVDYHF